MYFNIKFQSLANFIHLALLTLIFYSGTKAESQSAPSKVALFFIPEK